MENVANAPKNSSDRQPYEGPEIIDLGTIDEVTKGGANTVADVGANSAP